MTDAPQGTLEQQLADLGVSREDVLAVARLLAATARGQSTTLVEQESAGVVARTVHPLPTEHTVLRLAERLATLELRLKETHEKLDRVLTALSARTSLTV
jgi:hypothetical protein